MDTPIVILQTPCNLWLSMSLFRHLLGGGLLLLCSGAGRAAPVSLPSNAINSVNRTVRIQMTGSNGVQYFVRGSTDLTNWPLMQTSPVTGIGSPAEVDVSMGSSMPTRAFFRIESNFEQRARLFISNYQRQLNNDGPTTLSVNGVSVQNTVTLTEDATDKDDRTVNRHRWVRRIS